MSKRWTGGQYSLYRAVFGTYLFVQLLCLSRFIGPGAELPDGVVASPIGLSFPNILSVLELGGVLGLATVISVFLVIGLSDRIAAVVLWYVWLCLLGKGFLVSDPETYLVGFLLLAHAFVPSAPYGSWDARGRVDPGGGWYFPRWVQAVAWIWLIMLVVQLALSLYGGPPGLGFEMVFLLLFAFDPGWVKPLRAGTVDRLFYDGTCGLCHRTVRFLLAEDASGTSFRYAPLDSDSFREHVPAGQRAALPDSVALLTSDGALLVRSRAILTCMKRLGGYWRAIAIALGVVPASIADWVYDRIASIRYRLFRRPTEACPILPPKLRERFDA